MEPRVKELSAASLAYLGDAVFELLVRENLVANGEQTLGDYNRKAKEYVSARTQSDFYHKIYNFLTEEEQAVLKRGRNMNTVSRAKNASVADYRHATGLEALFGYLHHHGLHERMREIFNEILRS
jgi:ribonuclease-3 family protein